MARRLMNNDPRKERATQQRLTTRIANARSNAIKKAIARSMKDAAEGFQQEGRPGIGPAIEAQRSAIESAINGMYQAAWDTLGGRVLRAAKDLHGQEWVRKQSTDPDDAHAEELRQFIAAHSSRRISMIQTTTDQQIKRIIEQGERDGLGIEEIARRIRTSPMSRIRSQVIARTEVHAAAQASQDAAARAGGAAQRKEWYSALDDRTRDDRYSHVDADGEVTGVDGVFTNTGENMRYPGDPRGSAGNTVMCRCGEGFLVD